MRIHPAAGPISVRVGNSAVASVTAVITATERSNVLRRPYRSPTCPKNKAPRGLIRYATAKPPSVIRSDAFPPPKKTRDNTVVKYRYNVKSYHSTMVENAAITIEPREIGWRVSPAYIM